MKLQMSTNQPKFSKTEQTGFYPTLITRVNAYFASQNKSKHFNSTMIFKTIFMFALFLVPYGLLYTGMFTSTWSVLSLYMVMGFGMSGIGLSVMHDANHSSYSSKKSINKYLGYSMNFIGANAEIWKLQHNVLHHVYTNIQGADDDIETPPFLRFSPYKELRRIHRFQFLYVWFFYGLSTISWVTGKEFVQLYRYRRLELIKTPGKFRSMFAQLIGWKLFYYFYMLALPLMLMPLAGWQIFTGFLVMHFIAGLTLSLIFQTAHVMPVCDYQLAQNETSIETEWAVHEMKTTNNFALNSRFFSWFVGGLNFQIEHHLFPQICHVHYKQLSKIVSSTAEEFGITYNHQKTFFQAIWLHAKMLYHLGRVQPAVA